MKQVGKTLGGIAGVLATALTGGAAAPVAPLFSGIGSLFDSAFKKRYGGVVEVEDAEVVQRKDSSHKRFKGKTHEEGGITYIPKTKEEFIYSNAIGFNNNRRLTINPNDINVTLADKATKMLKNPSDKISKNTLNVLRQQNNVGKTLALNSNLMKYGGKMYLLGGPIKPINKQMNSVNLLEDAEDELDYDTRNPGNIEPIKPSKSNQPINQSSNPNNIRLLNTDNLDSLNSIAFASKLAPVAINALKSILPVEKEKERQNPEAANVKRMLGNLNIDNTEAFNQINRSGNAARRATSRLSSSVASAQDANISANEMSAKANAAIQNRAQNNQYRAAEAQARAQLGTEERMEQIRTQEVNSQNRAARGNMGSTALGQLSQLGTTVSQYTANEANNRLMLNVLGSRYANFTIDPELLDRIQKGTATQGDWIKFRQITKGQ